MDGEDRFYGGAGEDALFGGAGDDLLVGGKKDDRLTGGTGADRFLIERSSGNDIIVDFNFAEGDRLVLAENMRIERVSEVNADGQPGVDSLEIAFDKTSVTLLGLTNPANVQDFLSFA